jgi:hypothetical protein
VPHHSGNELLILLSEEGVNPMRNTLLAAAAVTLVLGAAPTFASGGGVEQDCPNVLAKGYDENPAQWRFCEAKARHHPAFVAPYYGYAPYYGEPGYAYAPYGYALVPLAPVPLGE